MNRSGLRTQTVDSGQNRNAVFFPLFAPYTQQMWSPETTTTPTTKNAGYELTSSRCRWSSNKAMSISPAARKALPPAVTSMLLLPLSAMMTLAIFSSPSSRKTESCDTEMACVSSLSVSQNVYNPPLKTLGLTAIAGPPSSYWRCLVCSSNSLPLGPAAAWPVRPCHFFFLLIVQLLPPLLWKSESPTHAKPLPRRLRRGAPELVLFRPPSKRPNGVHTNPCFSKQGEQSTVPLLRMWHEVGDHRIARISQTRDTDERDLRRRRDLSVR